MKYMAEVLANAFVGSERGSQGLLAVRSAVAWALSLDGEEAVGLFCGTQWYPMRNGLSGELRARSEFTVDGAEVVEVLERHEQATILAGRSGDVTRLFHSHPSGNMPSARDMEMLAEIGPYYGITEGVVWSAPVAVPAVRGPRFGVMAGVEMGVGRPAALWHYDKEVVLGVEHLS